jgi:hypothetical protein
MMRPGMGDAGMRAARRTEAGGLKGIGRLIAVLAILVVGGVGVGAVTWNTDTCTVDTIGASMTFQGWGSNQACQDLLQSKLSDAVNIVHFVGGVAGFANGIPGVGDILSGSSLGSPYGVQNCTGWDKYIHYTVAHESFSQNPIHWATGDLVAHHYCSIMPNTQPFGL